MNRNLWLLALLQGLFLTNNVTFVAINGLVGLALAPRAWMATLPVMAYVLGGALCTAPVSWAHARFGRKTSFYLGLGVALASALLGAFAAHTHNFWLLCTATMVAGYYFANGQLYRFTAAELAAASASERAISLVLAGGLLGAVLGPNVATRTKDLTGLPFVGAYLALGVVAVLAMGILAAMRFPPISMATRTTAGAGRPLKEIMRQPVFIISAAAGAVAYGVMNLLMAASPLAMQQCGLPFSDAALVLEWHVIGMFAPGFFTGHLIKRFGALPIMGVGVALNLACVAIAMTGVELRHFVAALFLLGMGWNFLFTGSTTLSLSAYTSEEKNRAQGALNFVIFVLMLFSSFGSGALVTTRGWLFLNLGSLPLLLLVAIGLVWLATTARRAGSRVVSS
jgi:MFS family permease